MLILKYKYCLKSPVKKDAIPSVEFFNDNNKYMLHQNSKFLHLFCKIILI